MKFRAIIEIEGDSNKSLDETASWLNIAIFDASVDIKITKDKIQIEELEYKEVDLLKINEENQN